MSAPVEIGPFGTEQLDEVPLQASPLARVLAQIRFPSLSALTGSDETAHAYAAGIRDQYPILEVQPELSVAITPGGLTQVPGSSHTWRLRSADEGWQISFGPTFFAIDTNSYTSRSDLSHRLEAAWQKFVGAVNPPFIDRIGVRYINRIVDQSIIGEISQLVRPEVLGSLAVVPPNHVRLGHSLSESLYQVDDLTALHARWGLLPPGAVLDPTLNPVPQGSWVLDLDSSRTEKADCDPAQVARRVSELAERAYRYFRWAVTPAFLHRFGADSV
jgi:uncharacterized protein (TIGR04255 family)